MISIFQIYLHLMGEGKGEGEEEGRSLKASIVFML